MKLTMGSHSQPLSPYARPGRTPVVRSEQISATPTPMRRTFHQSAPQSDPAPRQRNHHVIRSVGACMRSQMGAELAVLLVGCSSAPSTGAPSLATSRDPQRTQLANVALPAEDTSSVALPTSFIGPTARGARLLLRAEYADLCQNLIGAYVQESATEVRVIVVGTRLADPCRQRAHIGTYEVALERPLGDRKVTSGSRPLQSCPGDHGAVSEPRNGDTSRAPAGVPQSSPKATSGT